MATDRVRRVDISLQSDARIHQIRMDCATRYWFSDWLVSRTSYSRSQSTLCYRCSVQSGCVSACWFIRSGNCLVLKHVPYYHCLSAAAIVSSRLWHSNLVALQFKTTVKINSAQLDKLFTQDYYCCVTFGGTENVAFSQWTEYAT
jgi:hypothetical protein